MYILKTSCSEKSDFSIEGAAGRLVSKEQGKCWEKKDLKGKPSGYEISRWQIPFRDP